MFDVGDYVVYGSNGVCSIREVRQEDFLGEKKPYYILSPVDEIGLTIYVPVDVPELVSQMRPLLTLQEVGALIDSIPTLNDGDWIVDNRARAEQFSQILKAGDRAAMLEMLRTIYRRREKQAAIGKKLYLSDEHAFEKAERLLYGEFAVVLQIRPEEVTEYIRRRLSKESVDAG